MASAPAGGNAERDIVDQALQDIQRDTDPVGHRAAARVRLSLFCRVHAVDETTGRVSSVSEHARTTDIARDGLALVTDQAHCAGRMLLVLLPVSRGQIRALSGRVRRCTLGENGRFVLGLEFESAPHRSAVARWLEASCPGATLLP